MVDVVVRLHDPTDPSTERTTPPSSAHVQLDDVPRTPIQQSFAGEFRQHDGMMTVLMMLPTQGFALLRPELALVFLEVERVMQQSSVSISLSF